MDLEVRPATRDDARFVWEINSHPSTREQSVRTDPIPWESHVAWFEAKLRSESLMLIGLEAAHPVGFVRFDFDGTEATISVAVAPDQRGKGIGKRLIELATDVVLDTARARVAIAYVRPTNAASLRAFEAAGYERVGQSATAGVMLLRLEKRRRGESA